MAAKLVDCSATESDLVGRFRRRQARLDQLQSGIPFVGIDRRTPRSAASCLSRSETILSAQSEALITSPHSRIADNQIRQVITIPTTHAAIVAVAVQPSPRSQPLMTNFPMTLRCAVIIIITLITGTATMPLITALQYRALMGSSGVSVMIIPSTVEAARVP